MRKILAILVVAAFPVSVSIAYQRGVRDEQDRVDANIKGIVSLSYDTGVKFEHDRIVKIIKDWRDANARKGGEDGADGKGRQGP